MINRPTADFIATTFDVALAQGEDGAITAKIGTGLDIPSTNSFLQVDYNSTETVGDANAPETIFYGTYTSGTGALTGVVRGQAGTTDVAHAAGAEVQCAMSTAFLDDNTGWKIVKDTWAYASASTITVPSGAASLYSIGDKLKLTQTTVKYFYVTAVADTVLTVTGGTDYTVANATITANYYSKQSSPVGFPTQGFTVTAGLLTMQGSRAEIRGWSYMNGNGTGILGVTLAFGFTFTEVPKVIVGTIGGLNGSDPAAIGDLVTNPGAAFVWSARSITTSQAQIEMRGEVGVNATSGFRYGYDYLIVGQK